MDQLAKGAGYKHASALQRYENPDYKEEYFPLKFVRRIAPALAGRGKPPITADEIYSDLAEVQLLEAGRYHMLSPDPTDDEALTTPAQRPVPKTDIPVHGTVVGGENADFSFNGEIVDYVKRPPGISHRRGVFAVFTVGRSMVPWRQPGDLVYLDDSRSARPGDYVVVELRGEKGEPGPAYLKKLITDSDAKVIRLAQFNPPNDHIEIPKAKVKTIYRVVDWPELLGL
jgi:phage repressor protein C with HTH and peptisase S24 domain